MVHTITFGGAVFRDGRTGVCGANLSILSTVFRGFRCFESKSNDAGALWACGTKNTLDGDDFRRVFTVGQCAADVAFAGISVHAISQLVAANKMGNTKK